MAAMRLLALSLCLVAQGMKLKGVVHPEHHEHVVSEEEAARDALEEEHEAIAAADWAGKPRPAPKKVREQAVHAPRSPPKPTNPPQNWDDHADDGALEGNSSLGSRAVAWFHSPKTAISFGSTLFRYANASFPQDVDKHLLTNWMSFFSRYHSNKWFQDGFWHHPCDHAAVTDKVYNRFKGHFVGLFREPKARVFSAWTQMNEKSRIAECAERMNGTVAMQLAGQAPGEMYMMRKGMRYCYGRFVSQPNAKPEPNLALAVERLKEGFKFVGLVEEYELSICLFHAKFGGECSADEFQKMRPGHYQTGEAYESRKKELADLGEDVDKVLYDIAKKRFWADVRAYGVNRSSCKARCPMEGLFESAQESYSN